LWYRAAGFVEGADVEGDVRGPGGIRNSGLTFTEDSDGLYYFDYDFLVVGSYVMLIRQDGVKVTSQNFIIEKPPSSGSGIGRGGPNLLNI